MAREIKPSVPPIYPFNSDFHLVDDTVLLWRWREWLGSGMRLRATPECRALYFDLICLSLDQEPIGTLPIDIEILAKLVHVDVSHFRALACLPFGPLHGWQNCLCNGDVRLMNDVVICALADSHCRLSIE